MCDLINDCGDWSDEDMKYCLNNFECKNKDKVTRVIAKSKTCNGKFVLSWKKSPKYLLPLCKL